MPAPIEIVEAEAMRLSPTERADLADKLWLSVHSKDEVDAAWDAEIARRIQQIDSGEVECIPWETVMEEPRSGRADLKKVAAGIRELSAGRRQTPSEDLLRECRGLGSNQ